MKINFSKIFFLTFLIGFIFIWQGIYLPKDSDSQIIEYLFSVEKGQGGKEIALNLEKEGLIKSASLFRFYILTIGKADKLQAGDYFLTPLMTIHQIAKKLYSGDMIRIKVTIPEGFTIKQIDARLSGLGLIQQGELIIFNSTLEGFLFPDTYQFSLINNPEEIIKKMLDNFDKKLTLDLRKEIETQNKTVFEIITMASLIEKEVKTFKDKKLVSGILWKRIENNIPLQVDATIIYITGKKTTKVFKKETQIDSPYNTYKYLGLPVGPISNPGLESILAAIYPESSDYWYYLSTLEGETIFSRNLEEHNIAKVKYLK